MTVRNLRALVSFLSNSVDEIERVCTENGSAFPDLNGVCASEPTSILADAQIQAASKVIVAAASQLIAAVQAPQTTTFNASTSYYLSASLRTAVEAHVVEILRDAGPMGMHTKEIAAKTGIDSAKLARILRYLATNYIFREVEADVFANNLTSSVLDTGKAIDEILTKPIEKYDGTNGLAALVTHCADEDYKGAGHIIEHLTSPDTASGNSPDRTPMMLAFGSPVGVWEWFEQPSNAYRLRRFGAAMKGVSSTQPPSAILQGFAWSNLPSGSVVVDIGGGIGVSSIAIAQACPHVRCIVQDRPQVTIAGENHCETVARELLTSGRVAYTAHDFFEPQPVAGATVYLLKQILHDWPDDYVLRILQRVRAAADTTSKLVLVETIIQHACAVQEAAFPGATFPTAPAPLLANFGPANLAPYITDLSMYVHFNAQERSFAHLAGLLRQTGWAVEGVYLNAADGGHLSQIVATPM